MIIDVRLLGLLFVPVPFVAVTALLGLIFATAGAAGDRYLVAKLLRMPPGTILYDSDVRHMCVFTPDGRADDRKTAA